MKANAILPLLVIATTLVLGPTLGPAQPSNDLSAALQRALFEEEANQDLEAAIQSYKDVLTQFSRDRKLAATAVYRLGECYRKQGNTNMAVLQYERITREFDDVTTLATLSRQNLIGLGASESALPGGSRLGDASQLLTIDEAQEVKRIQALIANSPDLINASIGARTRLLEAAASGKLVVARFLLDNGARIDARDALGATALHTAARGGHRAMVQLLLEYRADVQATDNNRESPLHEAAGQGFQSVAEVLLGAGADPNAKNKKGRTPLYLAVGGGHAAMAEMLIANKAEVNAEDQDGLTPLHVAAQNGHAVVVTSLLGKGAAVNPRTPRGETPLFEAVRKGHLDCARILLEAKANPDLPLEEEKTTLYPLHQAALSSATDMLTLLLEFKANPDVRLRTGGSDNGSTSLLLAILKQMQSAVEILLRHKANVNLPDANGHTPLHCALGQPQILDAVLQAKPDVTARNQLGETPLHWAAGANLIEAATKMFQSGQVDPNVRDNQGATPLHWAVRARHKDMVDWLLAKGADSNIPDNERRTPLDLAQGSPQGYATMAQQKAPGVSVLVPGLLPPAPRPVFQGLSRPPGQAEPPNPIAQSLKQHGALEERPEMDRIKVGRAGKTTPWPVFHKGTNDWNRFTLLEALGAAYDLLGTSQDGVGRSKETQGVLARRTSFKFPDLATVQIRRPRSNPYRWEIQKVDVAEMLKSGDCSKDVPLEWGDVVEIPEADHLLNETWSGFSLNTLEAFNQCWSREVVIVVKGESTRIKIGAEFAPGRIPPFTDPENLSLFTAAPMWLRPVLRNSGRLLASSDLSRVKVSRSEPKSAAPQEFILDCSESQTAPDFWLRNGDVIQVPDKPE